MGELIPVDVIIVAHGSVSLLDRCIESLAAEGVSLRVTIVDNGADLCPGALPPSVDVIHQPFNTGFGTAQNAGVRAGSAPFLLILNPDACMTSGALASGLAYLSAHPRVGAVQGTVRNADGYDRSHGIQLRPIHLLGRALGLRWLKSFAAVRQLSRRVRLLRDHVARSVESPVDVEWLAATALLIRREAFEDVAGFDERFFLYGEDLDLSRRLVAAGWRLVALPCDWAFHLGGMSTNSADREILWWRGTLLYTTLWWTPLQRAAAVLAAGIAAARLVVRNPRAAVKAFKAVVGRDS